MNSGEKYFHQHWGGTGRFGTRADAAPLISDKSPPAALFEGIRLAFVGDTPRISFSGAGGGKFTNVGIYQVLSPAVHSIFILDVGAQYQNVTWHANLGMGRKAYSMNANKIGNYGFNHPINLLGILKNDELLFSNARLIASMLIPDEEGGSNSNAWVGQQSSRYVLALILLSVLLYGKVTLPDLWRMINAIDGDDNYLKSLGREAMSKNLPYDVGTTLLEMYTKKKTVEKEWGACIGYIKDHLLWLADPLMQTMLDGEEDYLAKLADPNERVAIYLTIPAELTEKQKSYIRVVVGIGMLHCQRAGKGARPLFLLEEAATCGGADFIKAAVSKNRKYHDTHLFYQAWGQMVHHFGHAGANEIMASCGFQQYLGGGIRDIDTASMLARQIGNATILIDDPIEQAERAFHAKEALWRGFRNPFSAWRRSRHELRQSVMQRKTSRQVRDPSEIMRTSITEQILFPVGLGLPPFLADKLPSYWTNPGLAGRYGPDPLFPPTDRVRLTMPNGRTVQKRFITEAAPNRLAHMPNVSDGSVTYVQGFRTW